MLCEIPIPRAPTKLCPGAANGRNGAATAAGPKTQRPSATTASSANGASTADDPPPRHAEDARGGHDTTQRAARPPRPDQASQPEGAARDGEIHHRHERPERERGGPPHTASSLCGGL